MDSVDGLNNPAWLPAGIPQILGEYRLVRPLGRGGMGMVFEARHRLLDNSAAVKILHPQHFPDRQLLTRFQREMAAVGRIPLHDNLVRAKHAGDANGLLYLVMDLVDGEDLGRLLARHQTLPVPVACEIIRQALIGLQVLNEAKLVHRDLKPGNLMLTRSGLVKLLDLGLVRILETTLAQSELTPSQVTMGTFDYQAPEQAYDARIADIRSDIYSLGCTLYKLISGSAPFANCIVPAAKIRAHATQPFPSLLAHASKELDAVLARMVAKDPVERFQTPTEAAAALEPFTRTDTDLSSWVGTEQPSEPEAWAWHCDPNSTPNLSAAITPPLPSVPVDSTIAMPDRTTSRRWNRVGVFIGLTLGIAILGIGWNLSGLSSPAKESRLQPILPLAEVNEKTTDLNVVQPMGSPLFNLDEEKAYVYQNLLNRPPVLALFNSSAGRASNTYNFGKQEIHLESPKATMIHLGTTNANSFTYQIQFYQQRWTGGLGLYYGYHLNPDNGQPEFMYVEFSDSSYSPMIPASSVLTGLGNTDEAGLGPRMVRWTDRRQDIERPVRISQLFIEVKNGSLTQVSIDGVNRLDRLTRLDQFDIRRECPPQGALGIFCDKASGTLKEARFKRMSE